MVYASTLRHECMQHGCTHKRTRDYFFCIPVCSMVCSRLTSTHHAHTPEYSHVHLPFLLFSATRNRAGAVPCVPQLLRLSKMPRARGIGMRRPNKKKVEVVEVVEEAPTEETPQPEPPSPPSPPRKPPEVKPPASPSKTKLTNAQRDARRNAKAAAKSGIQQIAAASRLLKAAVRKFGRKLDRINSDARRKLPLTPFPCCYRRTITGSYASLRAPCRPPEAVPTP